MIDDEGIRTLIPRVVLPGEEKEKYRRVWTKPVTTYAINYNLFDTYKIFFKIDNILDKVYSTALGYNQMNRSFNFGIKRAY